MPRNALVWKNAGREAPSCPISRLPARTPFNPDRPQLQPRITLDAATMNQPARGDERQSGTKGQDQCCATREGQGLGWLRTPGPYATGRGLPCAGRLLRLRLAGRRWRGGSGLRSRGGRGNCEVRGQLAGAGTGIGHPVARRSLRCVDHLDMKDYRGPGPGFPEQFAVVGQLRVTTPTAGRL